MDRGSWLTRVWRLGGTRPGAVICSDRVTIVTTAKMASTRKIALAFPDFSFVCARFS
jgi:hypothetical protein